MWSLSCDLMHYLRMSTVMSAPVTAPSSADVHAVTRHFSTSLRWQAFMMDPPRCLGVVGGSSGQRCGSVQFYM
jgi:hypothetical protein